jgi:hypothetical protein
MHRIEKPRQYSQIVVDFRTSGGAVQAEPAPITFRRLAVSARRSGHARSTLSPRRGHASLDPQASDQDATPHYLQPEALNLQPEALHLQPEALHLQPEALRRHPQSSHCQRGLRIAAC